MSKYWIFRYRAEFPLVICVLTTLIYTINTNIFLYYRPSLALFVSLLIASIGFAIHVVFGKISPDDDFQFNKYSITNHTKQIGDYFIWLGCAVFSGSFLVIIIYTLSYILFYGILTKQDAEKSIEKFVMRKVIKREIGNFVLFMLGIVYLSALKNFLITEDFAPVILVRVLFLISIVLFVSAIFVLKDKRESVE